MLEEQRGTAAGHLHDAVGDLAQFEMHADGMRDPYELTGRVDGVYEFVECVEGHDVIR